MKMALEKQGIYIGLSRVYRLMRQHGIYTVHRSRHRPQSKGQGDGIYQDNILNRQFNPPSPNTNWVGDITYIRSKEGWVYLAVVLDLFNREVVG
jgi:putative transposase